MEFVAWFTHKYVMHGLLWYFHEDHHIVDPTSTIEKNDFFFLIFATPGILFMYFGLTEAGLDYRFWIGLGITIYGFAYFLVHDVFIHQRIKWLRKIDHPYFKAIRLAHKVHHKQRVKEGGECFGMLWVPMKYYKQVYEREKLVRSR